MARIYLHPAVVERGFGYLMRLEARLGREAVVRGNVIELVKTQGKR